MSRSFPSADRGRFSLLGIITALALVCLLSPGCVMEMEGALGEPIEMGPWTFEVERAFDMIESRGNDQYKFVTVELKLHNYEERHEKTFDDFLNGDRPGSIIAFPQIQLTDDEGTGFDGMVSPLSGGRMRSERWTVRFMLVDASFSNMMTSGSESARRYLDHDLSDFRLVITNPDRRPGQPATYSLRLE